MHRLHAWTGAGWWRRKTWLKHTPQWYPISFDGAGLPTLYACGGDPRCIFLSRTAGA